VKIAFAIKSLATAYGGAERIMALVAGRLAERGHEVSVVTFDEPGTQPLYPLGPAVSFDSLGIGRAEQKASPRETLQRVIALRQYLRRRRPAVAIGFMHSMFVPLTPAALGLGLPVIASEHIVPAHYRGSRLQYALVLLAMRLADRTTVVSDQVRNLYPRSVRGRMVVLPNPVLNYADNPRPTRPVAAVGGRILNVGRLSDQKDQKTLLAAFAGLAGDFPDWTLRIVGDGPLAGELQAMIRRMGLEDRITLAPPSPQIDAEYAEADLLAVSSRYESLGLVTAEALASGVPVVGFADCPGTNELVRNGINGQLAGDGDRVAALRCALAKLMADPARLERLAGAAPGSVQALGALAVVDHWDALCRSLASHGDTRDG